LEKPTIASEFFYITLDCAGYLYSLGISVGIAKLQGKANGAYRSYT